MATAWSDSLTPYLTKAAFNEKQISQINAGPKTQVRKQPQQLRPVPQQVVQNIQPTKRLNARFELDKIIKNINKKI